MLPSCNVARLGTVSRTKATRITTVGCMQQTVVGSGLKCQDFCGRQGFEERQVDISAIVPKASVERNSHVSDATLPRGSD
jgi:hypothetical protein